MRAFRLVFTVALALVVMTGFAMANDVTFKVNMTNHDTFDASAGDIVVVRGAFNGWDDSPQYPLADGNDDGIWDATIAVSLDSLGGSTPDTSGFKFAIVFNAGGDEWESVSDRELIIPDANPVVLDTVWFSDDDPALVPVTVNFAVNMDWAQVTQSFDPAVDSVIVRGALNGWGGMAEALVDTNDDLIYVGSYEVLPANTDFKYVIARPDGEGGWTDIYENSISNRQIPFGTDPVQLDTVWFDDVEPSATAFDIQVLFQVNMQLQTLLENWDPTTDLIVVRGNNSALGNWGGAVELFQDFLDPNVYNAIITLVAIEPGTEMAYKFVILEGGDPDAASWESLADNRLTPALMGTEPDLSDPADGIPNVVLPVAYFNNNSDISAYLTQDKDITFTVDVRPAYLKIEDPDSLIVDVQTTDVVSSIDVVNVGGFFNNWPWTSFPVSGEFDLSDADDDSIWTGTITIPKGTERAFEYKYGLNGYDVENQVGGNHFLDLVDDGQAIAVTDTFGILGNLYDIYIDQLYFTGVKEIPGALPMSFELEQNYPNPFNPSTTIGFSLPDAGQTMLRVFNVMGQQVAQHDMGRMAAGRYEVSIDASNLSSGVYFYRLESGQFTATKKMMLMK